MPRIARVTVPGISHHVTQRGNNREIVFFDQEDRRRYLHWLKEYANRHCLEVWAYCLMTNHIHLIVVPQEGESLSGALRDSHMRYTQYINRKYGRSGHLWQGRFYSCPLDEAHMLAAIKYVERNPIRAGLVTLAHEWPWSSAKAHITGSPDPVISGEAVLRNLVKNWTEFLHKPEESEVIERLRCNTRSGRPLGSDRFIAQIEATISRELHPKKPGRRKKMDSL